MLEVHVVPEVRSRNAILMVHRMEFQTHRGTAGPKRCSFVRPHCVDRCIAPEHGEFPGNGLVVPIQVIVSEGGKPRSFVVELITVAGPGGYPAIRNITRVGPMGGMVPDQTIVHFPHLVIPAPIGLGSIRTPWSGIPAVVSPALGEEQVGYCVYVPVGDTHSTKRMIPEHMVPRPFWYLELV